MDGTGWQLEVRDDGDGRAVGAPSAGGGRGQGNMARRAQRMGAHMSSGNSDSGLGHSVCVRRDGH